MPTDALGQPAATTPCEGLVALRRSGVITLARHGEPDISRKVKLHAAEYAAWWGRYELTGLRPGQSAPEALRAAAEGAALILCSTRPRSIESARAVAGEGAARIDVRFIEAPLPPPHWPAWFKLSPRHWGAVSRIWWWLFSGYHAEERRKAAQVRADEAAEYLAGLAAGGDNVLVIAHGFFNFMIGLALKRRGWSLVENQGHKYWSYRRFELRRA